MKMGSRLWALAILIAVASSPTMAAAQAETAPAPEATTANSPVQAKFVGVAGGALAGAEVVILVEAIFGVDKLWPYLTIPILGAGGGAVGGYFMEKNAPPQASVGLLVGSMVLLIPTVIAARSALAYDPDEEGVLDAEDDPYMFETPPSGTFEEEPTTTEIESQPEGAPSPTTGAPAPEGPPEPPSEETSPESKVHKEKTTENATNATETAREDEAARKRATQAHERRMAQIRRATAGALFFVDNDGSAALSVPYIDIRPSTISSPEIPVSYKEGVEVMVPLLRIDLP